MKLERKLFASFFLVVAIPIVLVGIAAHHYILQSTKVSVSKSLNSMIQTLAPVINEQMRTAQSNLRLLAMSRPVDDYLDATWAAKVANARTVLLHFNEYQRVYPHYFQLSLLDQKDQRGISMNNRSDSIAAMNSENASYFASKLNTGKDEQELRSFVEQESLTGRFILNVGLVAELQQSTNRDSRTLVVLSMYLDDIYTILQSIVPPEGSRLLVVDKLSRVLYTGSSKTRAGETTLMDRNRVLGHTVLAQRDTEGFFVTSLPLENDLRIVAAIPDEQFALYANDLIWALGAVMLSVTLFILLFNIFYIRRLLLAPIFKMKALVSDISAGVMTRNIEFNYHSDELDELWRSILSMRTNIHDNSIKIQNLAFFDELTGLPNRLCFRDALEHSINISRRNKTCFALVFLDLDNFKSVNDTLGHDVGDKLLIKASKRISRILGTNEQYEGDPSLLDRAERPVVARLGGDEFTLLLPMKHAADNINELLEDIIAALSRTFNIAAKTIEVGASIGVSMYPKDGTNKKELLKNADLAMYASKQRGKNCYTFFDISMMVHAIEQQEIASALRTALDNREMSLNFQAQIDVKSGNFIGFEALLRWSHPSLGQVSPSKFIAVAEANLQILDIGHWVLHETCQQIKCWRDAGYANFKVAINISAVQLQRRDICADITAALEQYDVPAMYLALEITESALFVDATQTFDTLKQIAEMGVSIALDDFGTGYSSLQHLCTLPVKAIKIDHSYTHAIGNNNDDRAQVFDAIVELSKKLKLTIIAEGVENQQQHDTLLRIGCNHGQGFFYGEPLDPKEADRYMAMIHASDNSSQKKSPVL